MCISRTVYLFVYMCWCRIEEIKDMKGVWDFSELGFFG